VAACTIANAYDRTQAIGKYAVAFVGAITTTR
jgi:hypothetical protein